MTVNVATTGSAGQGRAGQGRAGQDRAGQSRAGIELKAVSHGDSGYRFCTVCSYKHFNSKYEFFTSSNISIFFTDSKINSKIRIY